MERSAISNSISGFSTRRHYRPDELFHAVEEAAEKYSCDYLQVFVNAVAHGSIEGLLNFFKEGKGKGLVKFRAHTKPYLREMCFPELPHTLADKLCIPLLLDYDVDTALDVLAMSAQKRLTRPDEKIKEVYRIYHDTNHIDRLPLLDQVFGVNYSTRLNDIIFR